jgi:HD-like signal output (HDOD) protein
MAIHTAAATSRPANYGRGEVSLDPSTFIEGRALIESVRARLTSPDYRPPMLAPVALRVMELSRNPRATVDQIVAVLEQDGMLVARILRTVRSPFYAGVTPIRSLREAAVRLGLAGLRDIVIDVAFNMRIVQEGGPYRSLLEEVRRHSTMTAQIARLVSLHTPIDSDYAFLCGLLHDLGIAAILLVVSEMRRQEPISIEELQPLLSDLHEGVSGQVARTWGLPPELELVLETHHQFDRGGPCHPLGAVTCVAERLGSDHEHALHPERPLMLDMIDTNAEARFEKAADALRLTSRSLELIRVGVKAIAL